MYITAQDKQITVKEVSIRLYEKEAMQLRNLLGLLSDTRLEDMGFNTAEIEQFKSLYEGLNELL